MAQRQLLPHDVDAEVAVVGAVMINPDVMAQVMATVTPEDFYDPRCRKIFTVQRDLGHGLDFVTVSAELETRGWLKEVGQGFVTGTISDTPYSFHGVHYAHVVRDLSRRRQLIHMAARMTKQAFGPAEDTSVEDIISGGSRRLLRLAISGQGAPVPVEEVAEALQARTHHWAADPLGPGQLRGLSSDLRPVDDVINGLRPGDLILLAARPSMGKSALGFEIARRVASQGGRVLIFSLEMGSRQVVSRWASALSGVNTSRVERGLCPQELRGTASAADYLSPGDLARYQAALVEIGGYDGLYINEQPSLRAEQIRAQSLSQAAQMGGLDLIVVDHTGLIASGPGGKYELMARREGEKSRAMKALAKELGAPVILLQQLNRGVEARQDKRPALSDLRDSGEHEENADVVLGLYSAEYYKRELGDRPDKLELLCLKHRQGPRRKRAYLCYERPISRFGEYP